MAKFVDLEHIKEVLNDYPSSNSNKILNAIAEEYIYDEYDIRSSDSVIRLIIIWTLLTIAYIWLSLWIAELSCNL